MKSMETVTVSGVVEEIIYSNQDNGYTICDIDCGDDGLVTATGTMPYLSEGETVTLSGSWITHPDYGEQFRVIYYETRRPTDEESILRFLSSGIIPGIRSATAQKLIAEFGEETLDVLLSQPDKVAKIKGISKEKAHKMSEAYAQQQSMQSIVIFLQKYNISPATAVRVNTILGTNSVSLIKANPYILADRVEGISFNTADTIAFDMGLPKNSPARISSGIRYILRDAAYQNGHTYLPRTVLIDDAAYKLRVTENEVDGALSELISNRSIIADTVHGETVYYLHPYYEAEYYVARRLVSMAGHTQKYTMSIADAEKAIADFEQHSEITLAAQQKNAVISALSTGLMILTGGPGTGKTTTITTIIELLNSMKLSIALAAPTGRAAKRMSQVTGLGAKTIHRLLGTQMNGGMQIFTHDEENPLQADVIILDEVSMVDIQLMSSFLHAVKYGARLILCGDSDQLPSVGAGNVLKDIISSGAVPVIKLDRIFRQAQESLIIVNAHKINRGELPELKVRSSDFFFLRRSTPEQSASTVIDLYCNRLPKSYGINPLTDIQVLSPTKKGIAGTVNLNKLLQSQINPPNHEKQEHRYGNTIYRTGDKVMQTKNNYDMVYVRIDTGEESMGIFNGDMGIIRTIDNNAKSMTIIFDEDKKVEYPFTNLDELDLAYAITVHKSQGSEFHTVIMPVCMFNPMLMSRNLFYTAVTRAKNMVVLVGSEKTVINMTLNNTYRQRYTSLDEKLAAIHAISEQKNE